jgi:sialate O-acetylesterase
MLYNRMIHPLEDFPVRGVLWYQGESNSGDASAYRELFRSLIEDWRRRRGAADLPFLFVQLAGYRAPAGEDWPLLRESQSAALALPATAQVVLLDAGDPDDVHPRDKQVVGRRLALAARKVAYGEDVVHSGPVYRGHEIARGRVLIDFDHAGGGLTAGGETGHLGGFAIAGADRRFVPAEAAIERTSQGDRVAVWSAEVPAPVAVRYGWADHPAAADLYNREGLPAAPFRTDSW